MDKLDLLIQDLYKKFTNSTLDNGQLSSVKNHYANNTEQLVQDIYKKFTNSTLSPRQLTGIFDSYNLLPDSTPLKDYIANLEQDSNGYQSFNPGGRGDGALGKYQVRYRTHKDEIKKITGVENKDEFYGSKFAQEKYMQHLIDNNYLPKLDSFKKINEQRGLGFSDEELIYTMHHEGVAGAETYLKTGYSNFNSEAILEKQRQRGRDYLQRQRNILKDEETSNVINTANIDRVSTLRNIYIQSEKEARAETNINFKPRYSKEGFILNQDEIDSLSRTDAKRAKDLFYSKIDPTQYTAEEMYDAMNPGVRKGMEEKGRIIDEQNKQEERESGVLNKIGEVFGKVIFDDVEVADGKYNINDRTIIGAHTNFEVLRTKEELLARDNKGNYVLDTQIDNSKLSEEDKLKTKDNIKRIRERLLTKETNELNVKRSDLITGIDAVDYHLDNIEKQIAEELGNDNFDFIKSTIQNSNPTNEDIEKSKQLLLGSQYGEQYIKLISKKAEYGKKFNELPNVYKESVFLEKQKEKLQSEYDQWYANKNRISKTFISLGRFSDELVPNITSSIVEAGALFGSGIEATSGLNLNATNYLIDQTANGKEIRSSEEKLGAIYEASEFKDSYGTPYFVTFDKDGNIQDIYDENKIKYYSDDRSSDPLFIEVNKANKNNKLYQNRTRNFSGFSTLDAGLESAKDIIGMMIPIGGWAGKANKAAKLVKPVGIINKGLNRLKIIGTSERAREFGSSMLMFSDNFAEEAINENITNPGAIFTYGISKATLEAATEMVFPYATKLGDDIGNVLNRTKTGIAANGDGLVTTFLQKNFGDNWIKSLSEGVPPGLFTDFVKFLGKTALDATAEGTEELMVELANPFVNMAINKTGITDVHLDEDWSSATEWGSSFVVGAFMGGALGAMRSGLSTLAGNNYIFNKEARYYNHIIDGLKNTIANKELTDHFISSLEGKKPKEEIERLSRIIDNTRKDVSYLLDNPIANNTIAEETLMTAFELNMRKEGSTFGKLPKTIKEEDGINFLDRRLSELNKNITLGAKTPITLSDILPQMSITKGENKTPLSLKELYDVLAKEDVDKLIEETHDKVFSEANIKKQSNKFLQAEYTKQLAQSIIPLLNANIKETSTDENSPKVQQSTPVENPVDKKEDAQDIKDKKPPVRTAADIDIENRKRDIDVQLSSSNDLNEYRRLKQENPEPEFQSFIEKHYQRRIAEQRKSVEGNERANKLSSAEQINNGNLPNRYGASVLFKKHEEANLSKRLKSKIESHPNYNSEVEKLKANPSYITSIPELQGLFDFVNAHNNLGTYETTDNAIDDYFSSIENFNTDPNIQSAIDSLNNVKKESPVEKGVEPKLTESTNQIIKTDELSKKIKQGGKFNPKKHVDAILAAYNNNEITQLQRDTLLAQVKEKEDRLNKNTIPPSLFTTPKTSVKITNTLTEVDFDRKVHVQYITPDGNSGIIKIDSDQWNTTYSSDLKSEQDPNIDGFAKSLNLPVGTTFREVPKPDGFLENPQQEYQNNRIVQTILKQDDIVYYEVSPIGFNSSVYVNDTNFEIKIIAYYKDGKIVKENTEGASKVIIGSVKTSSENSAIRNILLPYYKNSITKSIPTRITKNEKSVSYHKGNWRTLESDEISKYEFDVVIQPYSNETIGLRSEIKGGTSDFIVNRNNQFTTNDIGKVIIKVPVGSKTIFVRLDTKKLKDNPKQYNSTKNALERILDVANKEGYEAAHDELAKLRHEVILDNIRFRDPLSKEDYKQTRKDGSLEINPRGGIAPIIFITSKKIDGKTIFGFVYKETINDDFITDEKNISVDDLMKILGEKRIQVPSKKSDLENFIKRNPNSFLTDLVLPINTNNKTYPPIFKASQIEVESYIKDEKDRFIPNTDAQVQSIEKIVPTKKIINGKKFKITKQEEFGDKKLYTNNDAYSVIKNKFEEIGVIVSDPAIEIIRELYNIGDKKIWGVFQKAMVILSSDAKANVGKHESFHILFNLFLPERHQEKVLKELYNYVKKTNLKGFENITLQNFEKALKDKKDNVKLSTEQDSFYETQDLLTRLEEVGADLFENYKFDGFLSPEFRQKYPNLSSILDKILNFIYDSYMKLQPYIPYLANRSSLNSLFYQLDKNYFGRGLDGKRLSRYKNIYSKNYSKIYDKEDPLFKVEGLTTKEAKDYASFVVKELIPSILENEFTNKDHRLTNALNIGSNVNQLINDVYKFIPEYIGIYSEQFEIENSEFDELRKILNDPAFKIFIASEINKLTGAAVDVEIDDESNLSEDDIDEINEKGDPDSKMIIKNSETDLTKRITGRLREYLHTLPKEDTEGNTLRSGRLKIPEYHGFKTVVHILYEYLTDSSNDTDMWNKMIEQSSRFPFFKQITDHIFEELKDKGFLPETADKADYIRYDDRKEELNNILQKSELHHNLWIKFGAQSSRTFVGFFKNSQDIVRVKNLSKDNNEVELKNNLITYSLLHAEKVNINTITADNIIEIFSKLDMPLDETIVASNTKETLENIVNYLKIVFKKQNSIIDNNRNKIESAFDLKGIPEIDRDEDGRPIKHPIREAVNGIVNFYIESRPNIKANNIRTVKGQNMFTINIANYVTSFIARTKENTEEIYNEFKNDIFHKYIPTWNNMSNTGSINERGINWKVVTSIGNKDAFSSEGTEYTDYNERQYQATNINAYLQGIIRQGKNSSATIYIANPVYSDATNITYMEVSAKRGQSILDDLIKTALAELSRIEYHSRVSSDSKNFNKNGGNFLLQEYLNKYKDALLAQYIEVINSSEKDFTLLESALGNVIAKELELEYEKYFDLLKELKIVQDNNKKYSANLNLISKDIARITDGNVFTKSNNPFRNYFYNQFYYNTQFIAVFAGDPAYYKTNSSQNSGQNFLHVNIDHLKRFKSIISPSTKGIYKDHNGNRLEYKRTLYFKDAELESTDDYKKALKIFGIKDPEKHNITDAQTINNPLFTLAAMEGAGKLTFDQRKLLQDRLISVVDGKSIWKNEPVYRKDDKKNGIKSIFEVLKPFYYKLHKKTDINGVITHVPFSEKNSEKTLLIEEAYRTKNGIDVLIPKENEITNKFFKDNYKNPFAAKVMWLFQTDQADAISFDSTLKIYIDENNLLSIEEFLNEESNRSDYSNNVVYKDIDFYGDQQEVPVGKQVSKNTNEGSQVAAIFVGEAEGRYKQELYEITDAAINEKIRDWKRKTATEKDLAEILRLNAVKQNKSPHVIDGYEIQSDGHMAIPIPYGASRLPNEAAINALAKGNIHEEIPGGTLINTSPIGEADDLDIIYARNDKGELTGAINYIECAITVNHPLIERLTNKWGLVTPETMEKEYGKEVADALLEFIAYRIPTEGPYSIWNLRVKYFLPSSSGAQIMLPKEATTVTGLDFDVDKLFALYNHVSINEDILQELSSLYNEYIKFNDINTEVDANQSKTIYDLAINGIELESTGNIEADRLLSELYNYTRREYNNIYDILKEKSKGGKNVFYRKTPESLDNKYGRHNKRLRIYKEIMQTSSWAEYFLKSGSAEELVSANKTVKEVYSSNAPITYAIASPSHQGKNAVKAVEGGRSIGKFANSVKHFNYTHELSLPLNVTLNAFGNNYRGIGDEFYIELGVDWRIIGKTLKSLLFASTENIKNPLLAELGINDLNIDLLTAGIKLGIPLKELSILLNYPKLSLFYRTYDGDTIAEDLSSLALELISKPYYGNKTFSENESFIVPSINEIERIINNNENNETANREKVALEIAIYELAAYLTKIGSDLLSIQSVSKFDTEDSFSPKIIDTFVKLNRIIKLQKKALQNKLVFNGKQVLKLLPKIKVNLDGDFQTNIYDKSYDYGIPWLTLYANVAVEEINHYKQYLPQFSTEFNNIKNALSELIGVNNEYLSKRAVNITNNAIYSYIAQEIFGDKIPDIDKFPDIYADFISNTNLVEKYPRLFSFLQLRSENSNHFVSKRKGIIFDPEIVDMIRDEISGMITDGTNVKLRNVDTDIYPNGYKVSDFANDLIFYGNLLSGFGYNNIGFSEITPVDFLNNKDETSIGARMRTVFIESSKILTDEYEQTAIKILEKHPDLAKKININQFSDVGIPMVSYRGINVIPKIKIKAEYENSFSEKSGDITIFNPYIYRRIILEDEFRNNKIDVLYKHLGGGIYAALFNSDHDPRIFKIYNERSSFDVLASTTPDPVKDYLSQDNFVETNEALDENTENYTDPRNANWDDGQSENVVIDEAAGRKPAVESNVELFKGFWTRDKVAKQPDKVFLFGDNTNDRVNTKYVPSSTQAVIRGLPNAIGIDTKKDRGTSNSSYFTDNDFPQFKQQVDEAIQKAKDSGKTIVIPEDGIGTGKAMLKEKAPKLFKYLQQELNKLKISSENKSKDNIILNRKEFQSFAEKELEKNPDSTIEEILEYYKKCKSQ